MDYSVKTIVPFSVALLSSPLPKMHPYRRFGMFLHISSQYYFTVHRQKRLNEKFFTFLFHPPQTSLHCLSQFKNNGKFKLLEVCASVVVEGKITLYMADQCPSEYYSHAILICPSSGKCKHLTPFPYKTSNKNQHVTAG